MIRAISLMAFGISLAAAPVAADDSIFWKSVGNWDISVDGSVGNGCFTSATWQSGTFLRIGLNPEQDNFYFLIGNDKWASLQPNQPYEIQIKFDRKAPWDVSANGFQFNPGELVYLHAQSSKADFVEEFMRSKRMVVTFQGNEIDTLLLTGSSRAFKEVLNCQEEMDKRGTAGSDPFAGAAGSTGSTGTSSGKKRDPFAD